MEKENIDKFNNIYSQMLGELKGLFDFTKSVIDEYDEKPDYVNMFLKNSILFYDEISQGDSEYLIKNHYYITDGIKFKEIWNELSCTKGTKESIWKYLHTLMFIISSDKLDVYVNENFKDHKKFDIMKDKVENIDLYLSNLKDFEFNEKDNVDMENSSIGNLAKEIMDEMGLDPSSDKQPNIGDLGTMMSKTFTTLQSKMMSGELDQEKMMMEAQQMMGGMNLFGGQPMPKGAQGMPKNNMHVNKRKVARKVKKIEKTQDKKMEKTQDKNN